tara:strand:- start:660 stop:848 length:189 start_codon:yes stop_codon:yes gene_type:complete
MKDRVRFLVYYYPFSFDEPGQICTEMKIYVNDVLKETWQSNKVLDGEEIEQLKDKKRKEYGK